MISIQNLSGEKSWLINQANAKNQSQINVSLKKAYFWGHPVIQEIEALKMLGPFYKKIIFDQKFRPELR